MHKRSRLHVRWPEPDAHLVGTAARQVDMSVSEFVRRSTVAAALAVLSEGTVPPARATQGRADGRSARSTSRGGGVGA